MKTARLQTKRLATTALLAILAAAALAQGPGGPGGPGQGGPGQGRPGGMRMGGGPALDRLPSLAQFAGRPEVAAELGLTDDQRSAIDEAVQAMRESMRPPQDGGDGPPDFRAMQAARAKAEADADAKVKAKLSDAQVKRLAEIQIQSMGLTAAMVPSVQAKLGLSDDQKAQLKALIPARGQGGPGMGGPGMGGPGGGGPGGPPPEMQGGQGGPPPGMQVGPGGPDGRGGPGGMNGRRQIETKIAAILTDDQKAALRAMGGKTIKLAPPQGRGPGGPGGGQGGPPPMDPR